MIALRYGTPPIVHRTGGLADTVVDVTRQPGAGDGLRLRRAHGRGAARGVRGGRSRSGSGGGAVWDRLIDRAMAVDFDWTTGSAPRYVDAYQRAVAIRREELPGARSAESAQGPEQGRGRLGRVGPLRRVGPAGDRDDVVRRRSTAANAVTASAPT